MDLFRQCISLKAGLHVIVGRDVKYLYRGGGGAGGGEQKGYRNPWTPYKLQHSADEKFINY